ncbi:MAG: LysR family transcriptional regulator [Gammaproteobacteria bacterium]|nr:LysR family transcriptional regulator [Gammaproteobacteria bacterium]
MNRLENMETFIRVVDTGGISAAADKLNVAKSAVSRRLKELETYLGVELFHRTTRKMNLTDTGRVYYQDCLRIMDEIFETELTVTQTHGTLKGNIKLALPSSFGLMHINSAISEFLQNHPQIKFDLDFNDREVDLMQEGFDLAIRITRLADSSLIARKIAPINNIICASPDYLAQSGIPGSPEALAQHKCLVYSLLRDYNYWHLINPDAQPTRVKLNPYIKASTGEFLLDAAIAGHGITQLPSFIAYEALKQGKLVQILDGYKLPQLNAYAIYPQTRHLSQRVRTLVDFLVNRFTGVPYWDRCFLKES